MVADCELSIKYNQNIFGGLYNLSIKYSGGIYGGTLQSVNQMHLQYFGGKDTFRSNQIQKQYLWQ